MPTSPAPRLAEALEARFHRRERERGIGDDGFCAGGGTPLSASSPEGMSTASTAMRGSAECVDRADQSQHRSFCRPRQAGAQQGVDHEGDGRGGWPRRRRPHQVPPARDQPDADPTRDSQIDGRIAAYAGLSSSEHDRHPPAEPRDEQPPRQGQTVPAIVPGAADDQHTRSRGGSPMRCERGQNSTLQRGRGVLHEQNRRDAEAMDAEVIHAPDLVSCKHCARSRECAVRVRTAATSASRSSCDSRVPSERSPIVAVYRATRHRPQGRSIGDLAPSIC